MEFKAAKDRSKGEILHCKLIFKKKLFRESDEAVTEPMFVQLSYVQVCLFIMKPYLMTSISSLCTKLQLPSSYRFADTGCVVTDAT